MDRQVRQHKKERRHGEPGTTGVRKGSKAERRKAVAADAQRQREEALAQQRLAEAAARVPQASTPAEPPTPEPERERVDFSPGRFASGEVRGRVRRRIADWSKGGASEPEPAFVTLTADPVDPADLVVIGQPPVTIIDAPPLVTVEPMQPEPVGAPVFPSSLVLVEGDTMHTRSDQQRAARGLLRTAFVHSRRVAASSHRGRFERFRGLGETKNPQDLFDAFVDAYGEGRSINVVHARVLEQMQEMKDDADPREATAKAILLEIGQGVLLDRMADRSDVSLLFASTTRRICEAAYPEWEQEQVAMPHGLMLDNEGQIVEGVVYLPSLEKIGDQVRGFRTYMQHLRKLSKRDPNLLVITPAADQRRFPKIRGVTYRTLPISGYELEVYAGLMFRQHQAEPGNPDSTLAAAWERIQPQLEQGQQQVPVYASAA